MILALIICGTASAESKKVGRALVTFYWVADESSSRYHGKATSVLRDPAGNVIAHTTRKFKIDLVRQGSGWLRDGRTVVYISRVKGESRFRVTSTKYGLGSTGCPLVPFRTIAVDPHFVELGSTLYIPQMKGVHLPDGTIHDGNFIASDRGIFRGAHIDVFAGAGVRGVRPFNRKGIHSRSRVTVYVTGRTSECRP
jgi:3D (Asp-Asp-Asp) domain-containing protein